MRGIVQKDKPARDPAYLTRVRELPCAYCGRPGPSIAHHRNDVPRGMGQKVSDYEVVPLCQNPCHVLIHGSTDEGLAMKKELPQWVKETQEALK